MANRPANAGSGRGLAPTGDVAPLLDAAASPTDAAAPRTPAGHRATRPRPPRESRTPRESRASHTPRESCAPGPSGERGDPGTSGLAWLPYLIVLAGAGAGMFVVWQGSKYAGRGAGLVGCSLLAGALARLILPARYAGLLASRRKASDVLAFAVFGAAVLAVALMLP
jgi:hypothetical protein